MVMLTSKFKCPIQTVKLISFSTDKVNRLFCGHLFTVRRQQETNSLKCQ